MNYLADMAADEFSVYTSSDSVSDWSCGADEVGQLLIDPVVLADQLNRDGY